MNKLLYYLTLGLFGCKTTQAETSNKPGSATSHVLVEQVVAPQVEPVKIKIATAPPTKATVITVNRSRRKIPPTAHAKTTKIAVVVSHSGHPRSHRIVKRIGDNVALLQRCGHRKATPFLAFLTGNGVRT